MGLKEFMSVVMMGLLVITPPFELAHASQELDEQEKGLDKELQRLQSTREKIRNELKPGLESLILSQVDMHFAYQSSEIIALFDTLRTLLEQKLQSVKYTAGQSDRFYDQATSWISHQPTQPPITPTGEDMMALSQASFTHHMFTDGIQQYRNDLETLLGTAENFVNTTLSFCDPATLKDQANSGNQFLSYYQQRIETPDIAIDERYEAQLMKHPASFLLIGGGYTDTPTEHPGVFDLNTSQGAAIAVSSVGGALAGSYLALGAAVGGIIGLAVGLVVSAIISLFTYIFESAQRERIEKKQQEYQALKQEVVASLDDLDPDPELIGNQLEEKCEQLRQAYEGEYEKFKAQTQEKFQQVGFLLDDLRFVSDQFESQWEAYIRQIPKAIHHLKRIPRLSAQSYVDNPNLEAGVQGALLNLADLHQELKRAPTLTEKREKYQEILDFKNEEVEMSPEAYLQHPRVQTFLKMADLILRQNKYLAQESP